MFFFRLICRTVKVTKERNRFSLLYRTFNWFLWLPRSSHSNNIHGWFLPWDVCFFRRVFENCIDYTWHRYLNTCSRHWNVFWFFALPQPLLRITENVFNEHSRRHTVYIMWLHVLKNIMEWGALNVIIIWYYYIDYILSFA